MLSEMLDNVWLISSRHASTFFSITKVTAQVGPCLTGLWWIMPSMCVAGAHLTCNLGRISKYTFFTNSNSKYQFKLRESVCGISLPSVPLIHMICDLWSQMKCKHRSHSTPHKLRNYSKYFNYWVRMDPIWNAVDFVGKLSTGFT